MEMAKTNDNLIEVNHLSVTFYNGKDENHAVEDVTFRKKGEVLGVVGESGSGKKRFRNVDHAADLLSAGKNHRRRNNIRGVKMY